MLITFVVAYLLVTITIGLLAAHKGHSIAAAIGAAHGKHAGRAPR